jgi:mono/diheme cytochrome c family protein
MDRLTGVAVKPHRRGVRVFIVAAIVLIPVVFGFGFIEFISATSGAGAPLLFTQIGANPTLCSPGTLAAENYAAIYDLYGTLTPTPHLNVQVASARQGELIFAGDGACVACHDVTDGKNLTGPSLKGIAVNAASRESGFTASAYLRASILRPDSYLVPGYAAGIMSQNYGDRLNVQQVEDLVTYLLTLK